MNDHAKLGLIAGILLIGFLLIGAVSASVLMNANDTVTEKDLNKITNEVVDELCSYIQIKDIIGKYQTIQNEQKIQKIAILINPIVTQDIDVSHITIKITTNEDLLVLSYSGQAAFVGASSLFDHPLWDTLTTNTFSLTPLIDDDTSMISNHLMNKNTDRTFILIKLPEHIALKKGDALQVTILPSPGMSRTVSLEAPLPTTHVVTLYP